MDSVWIVTTGVYSDYQIKRIFSDEESASQYAATLDDGHVDVEEYPVDASFDVSRVYWHVNLGHRTGCEWSVDREEEKPDAPLNEFVPFNSYGNRQHDARSGDDLWSGWVQAPTKDAAVKIAQEQLAMTLAKEYGMM